MDIRKYIKTQEKHFEQQEDEHELSSRKKQRMKSEDSVVIGNRLYAI